MSNITLFVPAVTESVRSKLKTGGFVGMSGAVCQSTGAVLAVATAPVLLTLRTI